MLPPGQKPVDGFPRFGTHLHRPPPRVPADPAIEIRGAVAEPFSLPLAELANLPRREQTSDFHCVAGWSATNLRWEGVPFADFHRLVIEPAIRPGATITHVVFAGLDRYQSIVTIEDALAEDVLIAEHLNGRPLGPDHGAPLRLISPSQYGFVSTKHLSRVEVHTEAPELSYRHLDPFSRTMLKTPLIQTHPRARVWHEERHRYMPAWSLRRIYRLLIPVFGFLSARGSREDDGRT